MEPVDLLNQTRVIRSDELTPGLKSFIFNKALPPSPPEPRIIMATAFVSVSYGGFSNGF
jgi:hypothetical protein